MDIVPATAEAEPPASAAETGPSRLHKGNGHGGGNGAGNGAGKPLLPSDSPLLRGLDVTLEARLGEAVMPIADLLALKAGSVLSLETRLNEPVELYLNDALVGRGEIVAVDDRFAVRIVEIAAA
jgi:flagellar motor switch protein FliN/FliY